MGACGGFRPARPSGAEKAETRELLVHIEKDSWRTFSR